MRRDNVQRRTKEGVPIFNKPKLSMDPIVKDVMRITYVYVATVDGRRLPKKGSPSLSALVLAQSGKRCLY